VICNAQDLVLLGGGAGRGDGPSEAPAIMTGPFPARSAQRPQAATSAPPEDFNQGITDDDVRSEIGYLFWCPFTPLHLSAKR